MVYGVLARRKVNLFRGEMREVLRRLWRGEVLRGEAASRFEREFAQYIGVREAVAVSSGRHAFELILQALDLAEGDEVLFPSYTLDVLPRLVQRMGLKPIFADITEKTFNVNPSLLEEKITPRTRVIVATHLFGSPCDLSSILEIAGRYGIQVVEDCAQACGAKFDSRRVGSFGAAAFFSFDVIKPINTFTGGMITTDRQPLASGVRKRIQSYPYRYGKLFKKIGLTYLEWALSFPLPFAFLVAPFFYSSRLMERLTRVYLSAKATSKDTHLAFTNLQSVIGMRQLKELDARNQGVWQKAQRLRSCLKGNISSQGHLPQADPICYFFVIQAGSSDVEPIRKPLRGPLQLDMKILPHPNPLPPGERGPRKPFSWVWAPHRGRGISMDRKKKEFPDRPLKSLSQTLLLRRMDVGKGDEIMNHCAAALGEDPDTYPVTEGVHRSLIQVPLYIHLKEKDLYDMAEVLNGLICP